MKKFLRFIGILLVILIVGFLILCVTGEKDVNIERSTTINGSKQAVWNQMVKFDNWTNWSPWKAMDSTMTYTVDGTDGEVGSVYTWTGEKSGKGSITNNNVSGNMMSYDMHFIEPFDATADGYLKVEGDDGNVTAIWGYHTTQSFFMRGMSSLMGMKSMLEASFDEGLGYLKEYVESGKASAFNIQTTTFPATTYASVRGTVKFADMQNYFQESYGKIYGAAGDRIDKTKPAGAIYYKWDEENGQADMAPTFAVTDGDDIKGVDMARIPESQAYMIKYQGGYSGSYNAHMALGEHLGKSGKELNVVIEEYVVSPEQETDSNKFVTNIYYLTK
ncbi:MAG: SRPBCC family protein [Flavipsychrobacter sp.]